MAIDQNIKKQVLELCKSEKYGEAAKLLMGDTVDQEVHAEVSESLTKVGVSVTGGVISSISRVLEENVDNIPSLKEKFENIVSGHVVHKASSAAPEKQSKEFDIDALKPEELESNIALLRKKQNSLIRAGNKPDKEIARQLTALITRKQQLVDADYGEEFKKKELVDTSAPQEGSSQWFVLPDSAELDKYEVVRVVVGSPMTTVLRDRYEKSFKINIRDDFRGDDNSLTPEGEFEKKKAIDKERTFVDGYKDTDSIEDQDIYVSQVASLFITDQYDVVESKADASDKNKKRYNFTKGTLVVTYNRDTKKHNVSIEGEIEGAVTVSIKRRTDSGRIIEDAFDIVEFRNSRPVLYAKSSKGNVALRNEDEIRRALNQADIDLGIPPSAVIGEGMVAVEENVQNNIRSNENKTVEEMNSKENDKEPDLTPPEAEEKPQEDLVPPSPVSEPEESEKEKEESKPVAQKPAESSITPPSDATIPVEDEKDFKEAAEGDAGYLRSQLIAANAKETSDTTKNYLAAQIAKAEGKSLKKVKEEFGLAVSEKDTVVNEKIENDQQENDEKEVKDLDSEGNDDDLSGDLEAELKDLEEVESSLPESDNEAKPDPEITKSQLSMAAEIESLRKETHAAEEMASKTMETLQDTLEVVNGLATVVGSMQEKQLSDSEGQKSIDPEDKKSKPLKDTKLDTEDKKNKAPLKDTISKLMDSKKKKIDPKSFKHPETMKAIKKRMSDPSKTDGKDDPAPITGQSKRRD